MIHIKAYYIHKGISRIARQIICLIDQRATWRISIQQVVEPLDISHILNGIAEEILKLTWRTAGSPPPEPGAIIFMERAENQRNIGLLQSGIKICYHIQISGVNLIQITSWQDSGHNISLQIVRRITGKIILAIYLAPLLYQLKVWHMAGHGKNSPLLGSRNVDTSQLLRNSQTSSLFCLCQYQLITSKSQCIQVHNSSLIRYHILCIRTA